MAEDSPVILAFAPGAWRWPNIAGSTRYHLWNLAGLGWRVVYVEPPTKMRFATKVWSAPGRDFRVLSSGWTPPFGVRGAKSPAVGEKWRRKTAKSLAAAGIRACDSLRWKPDVYWFGAPWHGAILDALPPGPAAVNHVYDELCESPVLSDQQRSMLWSWERDLVSRCDLVLCSSQPQLDRRRDVADKAILLENAVKDSFYYHPGKAYQVTDAGRPFLKRMSAIPQPRVVYGGVADLRLNPELFRAVLRLLPEAHLVFLGTVDDSLDADFAAEMRKDPRVHLFGDVPYDVFPALYRMADVLVIGHKRMPFTEAMYPEKFNEYLAVGKPIVSVKLPEVARVVREHQAAGIVRLADTPEAFAAAVSQAIGESLSGDDRAAHKRVAVAQGKSWSDAADKADRHLRQVMATRRATNA